MFSFEGGRGGISPNIDMKNMISTYVKDFPWKKKARISQIFSNFFFRLPDFDDKFRSVANKI